MTRDGEPAPDLQAVYARLGEHGEARLRSGYVSPDVVPTDGAPRWGVSVVARLDGETARELAEAAAMLGSVLGPEHLVHREDTLHVTLRTLEHHRAVVAEDDGLLHGYASALEAAAHGMAPFRIGFAGTIPTPGGVLVAGWPDGDGVWRLRRRLVNALEERNLAGPPEDGNRRTTAHASLAVFMSADVPIGALFDWQERYRSRRFPTQRVESLQLVQYRFRPRFEVMERFRIALHEQVHR